MTNSRGLGGRAGETCGTAVEEPVHRRAADSQCIDDVLDREQLGTRCRD
jgi:hypothetical protein